MRVSLRAVVLGVLLLLLIGGSTGWTPAVSNLAALSELRSRFGRGVEPRSTLADVERVWQLIASTTSPSNPVHWRAMGEMALLDRKWDKAVAAFQQGIPLSVDPFDLYIALAQAQSGFGDSDSAISSYWAAVQLDPGRDIEVYIRVADIESRLGDYLGVVTWCERARQSFPDSHIPDRTQGIAAYQFGKWEEAERLLRSAHQKNISDSYPLYYLALTKAAQGEFYAAARYMEQAIAVFAQMAGSFPLPCDWYVIAGDFYRQAQDCRQAGFMYQQGNAHCPFEDNIPQRLEAIQACIAN